MKTRADLFLVIGGSSRSTYETGLLLLLRPGMVVVEEFEHMGELGNGGWDLETLVQDDILALQTNIFRPIDGASQVCPRMDVLTWIQFR